MERIFDCHTHEVYSDRNGFLIALDGCRGSDGGYGNKEVVEKAIEYGMIPVQYITNNCQDDIETQIIKFHARREKYNMKTIAQYIERYNPKAVIMDTLNEPYFCGNDYWELVMRFPQIQFLLSHAGGIDMLPFIKIAMFQKNAWIDFCCTQHIFGWCGDKVPLPNVVQCIDYALKEKSVYEKVLFGSDNLRGEKDLVEECLQHYKKYESYNQIVKNNHLVFLERCGL